jgi:hypothetical protein
MLNVHVNHVTWPCRVDMIAQLLLGAEFWVHVCKINVSICTCIFTHTHNIKWTLTYVLMRRFYVFYHNSARVWLCKFMRWRFVQGQKCRWSYRWCGSCLKSKLLIGSTGTQKNWRELDIQIEISVQFCGDLMIQLFRLNSFIVSCSYPVWIIVVLFILNFSWIILVNCNDGDE